MFMHAWELLIDFFFSVSTNFIVFEKHMTMAITYNWKAATNKSHVSIFYM